MHRIRFFAEFILPAFRRSASPYWTFSSSTQTVKGPDHSEPSVSGLPVTCVSYESESMDDDADTVSDLGAVYMYISISI